MQNVHALEKILQQAAERIGEADCIHVLTQKLCDWVGASCTNVFAVQEMDAQSYAEWNASTPADFFENYIAQDWLTLDLWRRAIPGHMHQILAEKSFVGEQLVSVQDLAKSRFYAEVLAPVGKGRMASLLLQGDQLQATHVMAFNRPLHQPGFGDDARWEVLRRYRVPIQTIFMAHQRLKVLDHHLMSTSASVEQLGFALLIATGQGDIVLANQQARTLLGLAKPAAPVPAAQMHDALNQVWHNSPPHTGKHRHAEKVPTELLPLLHQALAQTPLACKCLKLPKHRHILALAQRQPGRTAAQPLVEIKMLNDALLPQTDARLDLFARHYRLTTSEKSLLPLLLYRTSPHDMAQTLGLKVPTVRTHLAALFLKTGTKKQSDLVYLLNSLCMMQG